MYAYIKGQLVQKRQEHIVVEAGGIGYLIYCLAPMQERVGHLNDQVTIYTFHYVREDTAALYGFSAQEELDLFLLLLQVSGIGPKVASTMASYLSPSVLSLAVISGDIKKLTEIKGLGKKGAERVILELKDKLKGFVPKDAIVSDGTVEALSYSADDAVMQEAISAMIVLGYSQSEAVRWVAKSYQDGVGTEALIRSALRTASGQYVG